ncbi:hypothetical protein BT96DRAFT_978598 [Gymnopus androsaceus JB14]|uniref:Uncharacterized protein n=1 Tax=Gymnopus androsaceus JB14 TaxID=1447944 RepID=A0A6A4H874_9AGAR|nr:hypothetical protein BT96DRAFT_978598 [Gymnopus androsaceus JB14]
MYAFLIHPALPRKSNQIAPLLDKSLILTKKQRNKLKEKFAELLAEREDDKIKVAGTAYARVNANEPEPFWFDTRIMALFERLDATAMTLKRSQRLSNIMVREYERIEVMLEERDSYFQARKWVDRDRMMTVEEKEENGLTAEKKIYGLYKARLVAMVTNKRKTSLNPGKPGTKTIKRIAASLSSSSEDQDGLKRINHSPLGPRVSRAREAPNVLGVGKTTRTRLFVLAFKRYFKDSTVNQFLSLADSLLALKIMLS